MIDKARNEFGKLVETVAELRGPNGCPWDKQQTHDSLKRYAIEEIYELVEAIESGDEISLKDELGDVLLQVLLHARIAEEHGCFDIGDVCKAIGDKLRRRHPHVFSDLEVSGIDEIWANWERIKRGEPGHRDRKSAIEGVPASLPALMRAAAISRKAARVGFDWPDSASVLDKLNEEIEELREAVGSGNREHLEEEIGDVLFTVVNVARLNHIDPEEALRKMLEKFQRRFRLIEKRAQETGRSVNELTIDEMDRVWTQAKKDSLG
jgi:tetrapyrrole methylase family protein/MazG family protein